MPDSSQKNFGLHDSVVAGDELKADAQVDGFARTPSGRTNAASYADARTEIRNRYAIRQGKPSPESQGDASGDEEAETEAPLANTNFNQEIVQGANLLSNANIVSNDLPEAANKNGDG